LITSAPAPALDRPAVLLVDDAKIVLRLVEKALSDAGFALRVTESAEEALKLVGEQEFACALVDRHLVDADGLDIIKDIRKRQPGCACMVITAYPSLDSAVDALRTGVVDYIQKPSADFYRIVDRVQSAIRVHRARDSQASVEASWAGREELLREAEKIVEAIHAAQGQIKPRGRAAWNRALAEAEAHVASLRARR
jgi:DNA-binding NtrC family response regulator